MILAPKLILCTRRRLHCRHLCESSSASQLTIYLERNWNGTKQMMERTGTRNQLRAPKTINNLTLSWDLLGRRRPKGVSIQVEVIWWHCRIYICTHSIKCLHRTHVGGAFRAAESIRRRHECHKVWRGALNVGIFAGIGAMGCLLWGAFSCCNRFGGRLWLHRPIFDCELLFASRRCADCRKRLHDFGSVFERAVGKGANVSKNFFTLLVLRCENSFSTCAHFSQTPSKLVALFYAAYALPGGFKQLSLESLIF